MSEWKKICCAVDFSDESRLAMEEAAGLASRSEGELALIHVVAGEPAYEARLPYRLRALLRARCRREAPARGVAGCG